MISPQEAIIRFQNSRRTDAELLNMREVCALGMADVLLRLPSSPEAIQPAIEYAFRTLRESSWMDWSADRVIVRLHAEALSQYCQAVEFSKVDEWSALLSSMNLDDARTLVCGLMLADEQSYELFHAVRRPSRPETGAETRLRQRLASFNHQISRKGAAGA